MTQVRLRILGESVIEIGDSTVEPSAPHMFALALLVAIERGKLVSRSVLAGLLFSEAPVNAATHNLRQLVYRLRQKGAPLQCTAAAVLLPATSVIGAPEEFLTRSYSEALSGSLRCALLPGYQPPTKELSAWVERYRDAISHKLQSRLAKDLTRARQGADWPAVERFARALLEIDPLNETATLGLAEAMARSGSKQRAVKLLDDYAHDVGASREELSLPPRFLTRRISDDATLTPVAVTPLIARASEIAQLTGAWSNAKRGRCAIACVTGERSVGKSRVLNELAAFVRLDGSGTVLTLRLSAGDYDRPMALFADVCRRLLQLPGGAGCSPDSVPYLQRLIGAPENGIERGLFEVEAAISESCTRNAILDLMDSVASERPLLICIDDADRLDAPSLRELAALPTVAPTLPVLFVLASEAPAPGHLRLACVTRLAPLDSEASRQMAEHVSAAVACELDDSTLEWCVRIAAGNPGHLELLVKHASSLRDPPSVPPSLLALYDERVRMLSAPARHVLLACAVYGNACPPDAIAVLTGLDGYALLSTLDSLIHSGLLTDADGGLSCRSAALAERLTQGSTHAVRSILNRRAAKYLEQALDQGLTPQAIAWRIADHWEGAGDRARTLHWRNVCWQQLISIGQPVAAADSIRAELEKSCGLQERAQLLEMLADVLRNASDTRGQVQALEDRCSIADQVGDSLEARLSRAADLTEARLHRFDDMSQSLPDLRALLRAPALDEERKLRIARVLIVTADSMLSESLAREALCAVPPQARSLRSMGLSLQIQVIYHAVFGSRNDALDLAEQLHMLAGEQELSELHVTSVLTASLAIRLVANREIDSVVLPQLFDRCVAASMFGAAIRVGGRLGSMFHEDGRLAEAAVWCRRTTDLIARTRTQRVTTDYLTLRVDLALADGDIAFARKLIEDAPRQFPMYGSPKWSNAYNMYRTRVQQYDNHGAPPPNDLERLQNWHQLARRFGRHDDHMEVLWTALTASGRQVEASAALREYVLESRREIRPCIYALRTRTEPDPLWEDLRNNPSLQARNMHAPP